MEVATAVFVLPAVAQPSSGSHAAWVDTIIPITVSSSLGSSHGRADGVGIGVSVGGAGVGVSKVIRVLAVISDPLTGVIDRSDTLSVVTPSAKSSVSVSAELLSGDTDGPTVATGVVKLAVTGSGWELIVLPALNAKLSRYQVGALALKTLSTVPVARAISVSKTIVVSEIVPRRISTRSESTCAARYTRGVPERASIASEKFGVL